MPKRILILSDTHCGHHYGLAHPEQCANKFQKKAWDYFEKGIKQFSPYDNIFCNGDLIDGRAKKNCGVELITTNLEEQSEMAIKILRWVISTNGKNTPKFAFTRGTPYHTGEAEDWENIIAKDFRYGYEEKEKNIDESLLINVENVIFDLKHKIGSSAMPQTRVGAPAREIVQAMIKENYQDRPKADVFIRSHVHYHTLVNLLGRIAFTTPALQINSSYGQRQCSGIIDFGFMIIDVNEGKVVKINSYISRNPIKQDVVISG
jgi:hypothetical protein